MSRRLWPDPSKKAAYEKGDLVYAKGDSPSHFYILVNGCVEVLDGKSSSPMEGLIHFGDMELFDGRRRRTTVKVISDTCNILRIEMDMFVKLLSPFKEKFQSFWAGADAGPILIKDLIMGGLLTRASMGVIEACRHRETGGAYVLKTLRKDLIIEKGLEQSVMRERAAWVQLKCPFIVQLCALYNEPNSLHFLSEFAPFGSLAELFHSQCLYSSERHARFYLGGVVIALRHLQKRHIIHRDVKPDNVLVTKSGHPKLYDFALSKPLMSKTFTLCGTPEYMAPEVFTGSIQTRAVDWWSAGIMLYELMTGTTPFRGSDPLEVYANVMEGWKKVEVPKACGGAAFDIIHRQCQRNPEDRLCAVQKVMAHPWFEHFDWEEMATQRLEPPYRPPQTDLGGMETRTISVANHDLPLVSKYKDDGNGWDQGFASSSCLMGSGLSGGLGLSDAMGSTASMV